MYDIALVRVDNRLVHGQILEAWVPFVEARCIMVVDDNSASDFFCETVIRMAVPSDIEVNICSVEDFAANYTYARGSGKKTIVLFSNITDALRAYEQGFHFETLNIGNLHYGPEKMQILPHVALSAEDREDLRSIQQHLVLLDFRSVPTETVRGPHEQLI